MRDPELAKLIMAHPPLRRAFSIHEIPIQNREESEELEAARKLLRKVESDITRKASPLSKRRNPAPPRLSRKKSEQLLVKLEAGAPLVRSPGYQRDLGTIIKLVQNQQYFKHPKTIKRLNKLLKPGHIIPTIAEMVNIICKTEKLSEIVQYVSSQDPNVWTQQAARALVYDGDQLRPEGLVISYMICNNLLKDETPETALREENLISRLIVVWMPPIQFNHLWGGQRKVACKVLQLSLQHLANAKTEFHRILQRQLCEEGIQNKRQLPLLYITVFLRFYVPQFLAQAKCEKGVAVKVSKLVQGYINNSVLGDEYRADLEHLRSARSLKKLSQAAQELFSV